MRRGVRGLGGRFPLIGMIHLRALPGSPDYEGVFEPILATACAEAQLLAEAGFDALMVENFGDAPFYPDRVPAITVAAMTRALTELREATALPLGVNVLRNDGAAAIAVAAATGADFVRVNVLIGATATDQGILEGRAHEIARLRTQLAPGVAILADARVKHGRPIAPIPLAEEVADLVERGGADAVLLTGARTGEPPEPAEFEEARRGAGDAPLLVASGVSAANVSALAKVADGAIVGTSLKRGGRTTAPLDRGRIRRLVAAVQGARSARGRR